MNAPLKLKGFCTLEKAGSLIQKCITNIMNTLSFRKGEKMDVPIKLEDFCTDKERGLIQKCITKIMNTLSFRKLSGKTQVILSLSGPNVRTRLTHTIEVAKIARDICKELELNEDLAEAIALAHDIGHTPFGHVGERTLREVMCGCDTLKDQVADFDFNNSGFKHNLQSFRVLNDFERLGEGNDRKKLKNIWPFIFWGAASHTKMTWTRPKTGMDKEIFISCAHCDKVFSCNFHEKQECKRNVHKKKKESSNFSVGEFEDQGKDVKKLCESIKEDGYEFSTIDAPANSIEWLNEILQTNNLCEHIIAKKPEDEIKKLKDEVEEYNKALAKTHKGKQEAIKRLNRFTIKLAYPRETPESPEIEICKPWYCATLQVVDTEDEAIRLINAGKLTLKIDESLEDFIKKDFFNPDDQKDIFCRQKCYMAKLWEYKIKIFENNSFLKYKFLYDHPFPNSFYAKDFHNFFYPNNEENIDWISVEAVIVQFADEIAQRQQDLEDGIQKNLISMGGACEQVKALVDPFLVLERKKKLYQEINLTKNQEELGGLLVKFYIEELAEATRKNLLDFSARNNQGKINIYCLLNSIFSLSKYKNNTCSWIKNELDNLISGEIFDLKDNPLNSYFSLNKEKEYFIFIVLYYFDDCSKDGIEFFELFIKFIEYLEKEHLYKPKHKLQEIPQYKKEFFFIKELDEIWKFSEKKFEKTFEDIAKDEISNKQWQNLNSLTLYQYHILTKLIDVNKKSIKENTITVKNFVDNCKSLSITEEYNRENFPNIYKSWRHALGNGANVVFSNLVGFIPEKDILDIKKIKKAAIDTFKTEQRDTIINSEGVQKNDGKASYILKRLFKAFIGNSHQLPDECLKIIMFNLVDCYEKYVAADEECFKGIIYKLKETTETQDNDLIEKILSLKFSLIAEKDADETKQLKNLKHKMSNEIKALTDKRKKLYEFLVKIEDIGGSNPLRKEIINESPTLKKHLLLFRGILDNPILNATPFWRSILTRGICDYIASLTDQEAIDEYEKLYAGVMEIV